ncbi:CAP domain-containing protein [Lottiidibacillus patelloidae]|nr:CAP domain-containing protein [Lottiidibacillus patelloidae]
MKKYFAIAITTFALMFSVACNETSEDAMDSYVNPNERNYEMTEVNYDNGPIGEMKSLDTKIPSHKFPHSTIIKKDVRIYKLNAGQIPGMNKQTPDGKTPTAKTPAQQVPAKEAPTEKAPTTEVAPDRGEQKTEATNGLSEFESKVVELTNVERQKNGLPPLKVDTSLSSVARKKSDDMQAKNYFSHTSPTYGSPFDMIRDFGISYKTAGENIAKGQTSPQSVVNGWMNSEGHRKNILSKDFTHIGVGFNDSGKYWTQMFIGK